MSLDFDGAVNDYGRSRHDVVSHHLGNVLDFGEPDIEIVFADDTFHHLVGLLALGAAGTEDKNFAYLSAGRGCTACCLCGLDRFFRASA